MINRAMDEASRAVMRSISELQNLPVKLVEEDKQKVDRALENLWPLWKSLYNQIFHPRPRR